MLVIVLLSACATQDVAEPEPSDPQETRGERVSRVGAIASPIEWSADGSKLYATRNGELVEVDLATGSARLFSDACTISRAFGTTVGLAYLRACGAPPSLHLRRGSGDSVLATGVFGAILTPDRRRLIYSYADARLQPCGTPGCSRRVAQLDLPTMVTTPIALTGTLPADITAGFTATDGAELLAVDPLAPSYFTVLLNGGAWKTHAVEWQAYDGQRYAGPVGAFVGWTREGIWTIKGLDLGNALTGRLFTLPVADVPLESLAAGFLSPDGSVFAFWHGQCFAFRQENFLYICERETLRLVLHDLTAHTNTVVVTAAVALNNLNGPWRSMVGQGSFSPDGRRIAYVLEGDIYTSTIR